MRLLLSLSLLFGLATPVWAQSTGPVLLPNNLAPTVCDPTIAGFRYVQVRGSGFDAWATQRLVGTLVDASGASQARWANVWVSPGGQLTLELNLCADAFQNRPALAPGDYTVVVGSSDGSPIASAGLTLAAPAVPLSEDDQSTPSVPAPMLPAATPTPEPRTGPGSLQQPIPLGGSALLVDRWQFAVTAADQDAYAAIHSSIASAPPPAAGQQDVMVGIQATYVGPATATFSDTRLALFSRASQTTYDEVGHNCGLVPMAPPNTVVAPGTVVIGNVCFSVPASEVGSLVLVDNQPSQADRLFFALQ